MVGLFCIAEPPPEWDDHNSQPKRNAKDLAELPTVVKEGMDLARVATLDEVLAVALRPAQESRGLQVA